MENKTNIYYFNKDDGKKIKLKNCTIKKNFIYKRCDFILVEKHNYFFVCFIDREKDLYNIWSRYDIIDDELMSDNQILSIFRKEFDKNDITRDVIENFIKTPLKYSLLTFKGRRNKNLRTKK